jgi:hypothetical protein
MRAKERLGKAQRMVDAFKAKEAERLRAETGIAGPVFRPIQYHEVVSKVRSHTRVCVSSTD